MLKRFICLLCCVLFLSSVAAAEQTFTMAGFDGDDSTHDWATNQFFTRMQTRTGVSFTFNEFTNYDKWQTAKEQMFATGELPDVLFKAELTTAEQIRWAESGQLIDLKPLLAENAPNLWALLQAHPDWMDAITLPDGKIVALPTLSTQPTENAMWINKVWLDKLGLEVPTDAESFRAVLEAFKTRDPNGNGQADEIPLAFLGSWDLKFLGHAFGCIANDYNLYLDDAGETCFLPQQDNYRALLQWLNGLYADGLMDQQGFYTADTLRTVTDEKAINTYGVFFGPNPMSLLTYKLSEEYVVLMPLVYEGKQIYRRLYGGVTRGAFAITSSCADPAALLRWVDVLYGEEGAIEAMVGEKGKDYEISDDGLWNYVGDEASLSSTILYDLSIYDSGYMPWLFPNDFCSRYTNASIGRINSQLAELSALTVKPFPDYPLSQAQLDEVTAVQSKLGRYVDISFAQYVLGQRDPFSDDDWTEYKAGLVENGMSELLAFWQARRDANR